MQIGVSFIMRHLLCSLLLQLTTSLFFAACVLAQEDTPSKEPSQEPANLVITPNRTPTDVGSIGSSITVLDQSYLENLTTPFVSEALRSVPGLEVVSTGAPGQVTSVFIRGANSDHTLILIDGMRINNNSTGGVDLADLRLEDVERIEIIRGPQSVVYGSEAIGGVINIVTSRPSAGLALKSLSEGGSFGTYRQDLSVSSGNEDLRIRAGAGYLSSDGFSSASEKNGNSERDAYENTYASLAIAAPFASDGLAEASTRYLKGETDLDGFEFGRGPVDDPNYTQSHEMTLASVALSKPINETMKPRLELGFVDEDYLGEDPDTAFNAYEFTSRSYQTSALLPMKVSDSQEVLLGFSYERREAQNLGSFDEADDVEGLFVHNQWSIPDLASLGMGMRYDHVSSFGEELTYRLALSAPVKASNGRFKSSLGTGFKAPSLSQLYFPGYGNPDLDAEKSLGWDMGWEQSFLEQTLTYNITFFHNSFKDLIAYDSTSMIPTNISEGRAYGFENEVRALPSEFLEVAVSYTYTDSEKEDSGDPLPRRPKHSAKADLILGPYEQIKASASFRISRDREEFSGEKMDDYEVCDLGLSYDFSPSVQPYIKVHNLFDQDYEEVTGYESPDLSIFAGVKVRM